jgi:chloramphenicol-sensitive protein RarD
MNPARTGVVYACLAFVMWGLFPLYFRQVASVPALEVVLHRSVWSLAFVIVLLALRRQWQWITDLRRQPRLFAMLGFSALLIAANWLVYVHAIQTRQVVEASLGYFVNPLFNAALGVLVLHERLRRAQWGALALAAVGVLWLTWVGGRPPWIALALAGLFAVYGLVRKTSSVGTLEGLAVETTLIAPIALPALGWWTLAHDGAMARGDAALSAWLLLSGPLTALPLLWFTAGARRLRLVTVGLLQYISPTLQFALGLTVFGEPFDTRRLAGFVLIWVALALYSADAALAGRTRSQPVTPEPTS